MKTSGKEEFEENILSQYWFPFACFAMSVFAGLVTQSFIVAGNVIDWTKGRVTTSADQIITSLETSKVFFHTSCLLYFFEMFYFPGLLVGFSKSLALVLHWSAFSNICLSTLLSIFFYLKISTSHYVIFLRLKNIVSKKVVYLIIACLLLSVGYSATYFLVPLNRHLQNSSQGYIAGYRRKMSTMQHFNLLWNIFPLLMVFLSSALLVFSLYFHLRRLNSHGKATGSTDAYRRTMTFTGVSFLIWASYFTTVITEAYAQLLDTLWLLFLMNYFPALHSALLIYVATKLRNRFFRIVRCGTDCLFGKKAPGRHSEEPVEETIY